MLVKLQMLAALRKSPDSMSMSSLKDHIDPNLMDLYPHDCLFKVKYSLFSSSESYMHMSCVGRGAVVVIALLVCFKFPLER